MDEKHISMSYYIMKYVRMLIRNGGDVNAKDAMGHTPLHYAAAGGCRKSALLLLHHGADVNARDKLDELPLRYAIINGSIDVVRALLNHGAQINSSYGSNVFQTAVYYGRTAILQLLLTKVDNINVEDNKGNTLLSIAVAKGYTEIAKYLLDKGASVHFSYRSERNQTLLQMACEKGLMKIVKLLLHKGVDVNAVDRHRNSALHYTLLSNNRYFMEYTKAMQRICLVGLGFTRPRILLNLLREDKNITGLRMPRRTTRNVRKDIIHILLEHGANINVKDIYGQTPLHLATREGEEEICRLLLEKGSNVNDQAESRLTALHYVIQSAHENITKILLEHGANVNLKDIFDKRPLHFAVEKGEKEICRLLVERGTDVNAKDESGLTALYVAAERGYVNIMEILLNSTIHIDSIDKNGNTALHLASRAGKHEAVLTLIGNCSDVTVVNKYNKTALCLLNSTYKYRNFLDNSFDPFYQSSFDRRLNVIYKQLTKMQIVSLYIDEESLKNRSITTDMNEQSQQFEKECKEEIMKMKSTEINGTSLTFFDILTKSIDQIASYARHEDFVKALKPKNFREKFPMYRSIIIRRFNRGMEQRKLLDVGYKLISGRIFGRHGHLPHICTEKILSLLNNMDLISLKKGCENVHSKIDNVAK